MLLNIILSLLVIPALGQDFFSYNGSIDLAANMAEAEQVPQRIYSDVLDVKITAKSAIAVDAKTGTILYKNNSQEIRSMASITKLMTALVFLDHNPGWQKEIFTIASDRRNGGIIHLNTGEVMTLKDLFYTALIASDNDAAMALARSTGLSESEFINKMNQKAKQIGLTDTQFSDPTGLKFSNKSTAQEIIKLLNYALQDSVIKDATSTAKYEFEVMGKEKTRLVKLKNTDWLVSSYLNIIGGKTGHLEPAGYCLTVKVKGEQNQEILVVVLGSQTNFDRFQDVKAISDWVFTNYNWQ